MATTVQFGDVRGKFAVTGRCPYTIRQAEGGSKECRQPTAIVFDRYGHEVIFAPSFEALNQRLAEAGAAPARPITPTGKRLIPPSSKPKWRARRDA
jgi:hypothetical protein